MTSRLVFLILLIMFLAWQATGQEPLRTVQLPRPDTTGGKPLMQVLKDRRTSRSFAAKELSDQIMSNLLWAAFGINRPDGRRTAPSARDWQEIEIYVALPGGLFLYEARAHALRQVLHADIRSKTGMQDFVGEAPVNLVYVAALEEAKTQQGDESLLYMGADCGCIAQNVYLFCASEGLGTVVRGMVDRKELASVMKLRPDQRILLAQTVGYTK
jgi:SagB-type dehydrogenase family enzyme